MIRPEHDGVVGRFGRWLAARGWIHLLLLTGVAVFLYPMAWMVCTSIKTDEELAQSGLLPRMPTLCRDSPYIREASALAKPDGVDLHRWQLLRPEMLSTAAAAVGNALPAGPAVDRTRWQESAALQATQQVIARIASSSWSSSQQALAEFRSQLSPEIITQSVDAALARLELQGLELYTEDAQLFPLLSGAALGHVCSVESGSATLVPLHDGVRIDYHFSSGGDAAVVIAIPFRLPEGVAPSQFHKMVLSLRNDDSWHRIRARIDIGGQRWASARDTPLAQNRQTTITFQPPGFDDSTFKARTWVPLQSRGNYAQSATGDCALHLEIQPSSTSQAIWQKLKRNYDNAFHAVPFWTYLGNSSLLVLLVVSGSMFSSAFVAYAFARLRWPGRGVALILLLSTMMLPSQVTMIPSFLIWRELGWYNTLNPLWIGAWMGNAFFIFLMIQHLKTIPRELEEAARIDGLNTLQIWWYIIVPQLKPTLAAIAIMSFMNAWNDFMGPLIYIRDQARFPLSLGLFGMKVEETGADFSLMMAGDLMMTVPAILVFFCFQRYFIQGMTVSGMKG